MSSSTMIRGELLLLHPNKYAMSNRYSGEMKLVPEGVWHQDTNGRLFLFPWSNIISLEPAVEPKPEPKPERTPSVKKTRSRRSKSSNAVRGSSSQPSQSNAQQS